MCGVGAAACIAIASVAIVQDQISWGPWFTASLVHSWVGAVSVVLVVVQVLIGSTKRLYGPKKMMAWHGHVGNACYTTGMGNIVLAVVGEQFPARSNAYRSVVVCAVTALWVLAVAPHAPKDAAAAAAEAGLQYPLRGDEAGR